ncbi:MAG: alpha/beta fold hydrolase [Clostridia bacterium]
MKKLQWYRKSASGECDVFSQIYIPENPKAIIQIAHGMTEHSGRYKEFMAFLAENGYIVCANDHLGHGKTANGEFGVFAKKDGGFDFVIKDMHNLFVQVKADYPQLPVILFGHSMGSILSALFADKYDYLSKLILMGTPNYIKAIDFFVYKLEKSVRKNGYTHTSKIYNRLINGKMSTDYDEKVKLYAWLTSNEKIVREFVDDELCGNPFADSANLEMLAGLKKWGSANWGENIPDIPVLFIAGTKDKVAGYGKGAKKHYKKLAKSHSKLTLKLNKGERHELLNEMNKTETYRYILNWLT